jgi:hypothetical protein
MNTESISKPTRPQTPCIDIIQIRNNGEITNSHIKNFSSFFKQIIDNKNKNFIEGDINMIDYIISKYTNTNIKEIQYLKKINLKLLSEYGLLNQFGERLPYLNELKLTGSNIPFISDLGSSFKKLVVLNMDNCNLSDLSGIVCFENLVEFSAKNNKITDLFEIEALSTLKYIQLENNKIEDMENIIFLSSIDKLEFISLRGNPICENKDYEKEINNYLSFVKFKDVEYNQYIHFDNVSYETKSPIILSKSTEKECIKQLLSDQTIEDMNMTNKFENESLQTTKTNSLRNSTLTIKSLNTKVNNNNVFNFNYSNNNTTIILPQKTQLKPIKLKETKEKEDIKKLFEKHDDCLNLEHEKDIIMNKFNRK